METINTLAYFNSNLTHDERELKFRNHCVNNQVKLIARNACLAKNHMLAKSYEEL